MSNIDKHAVQTVADLKAGYTLGHADVAILNELARIALASLEAEPAIHRWRRVTFEPYGPYPWHYGNFIGFSKPVDGIEDEYYYAAPPAPVSVPAAMEMDDDFDSAFEHGKAVGWNAYRAAMLQGADRPQNEPQNIPENIPATQFKPVADLYGLTSPTGGETSFTFDAVEARDFIDGGWLCQEYVELGRFQEAMLQNGNSPAQSDCCPEQNYIAPAQDGDSPVIPDGWIPVSERMPGSQEWVIVFAKWDNQQVLCWDDVANRWTDFEDQSYYADMFTHWMPLPSAPQQEA
ncbi:MULTISPECIES: DUF551 domain-containing protein [Enterobacter]|uniref:DUF551 domain-containing protein n=1 Tax=Enterobacter TaxID=547 RepID=UPI000792314B|nr:MULTISPECIES: DUF551 domain-containing protein [Enterobacter]MDU1561823.1 DUF551 domain-containing protein [Enterobacter sp.]MEA3717039.1 DUF551 domain-containing protein [Enterobacter hormaechei]WMA55063.1 DUF551 domain-containing protein [Enterobacter hormaechei]SAE61870.1 Protein of uncharacterised function (DUF551) [Enterobacter hormaechei]